MESICEIFHPQSNTVGSVRSVCAKSGICVRLSGIGEDAGEGAAGVDAQAARGEVFVGMAAATFAIPCDVFGFQSRFE